MDGDAAEKIKGVFRMFDGNGDGTISCDEMRQVLLKLEGGRLQSSDIDQVFAQMDSNKDNRIQYDEFVRWLTDDTVAWTSLDAPEQSSKSAMIQSAIQGLLIKTEADGSGFISVCDLPGVSLEFATTDECDQILMAVKSLQLLDAKQLKSVFTEADCNKNGYLQLAELKRLIDDGTGDSLAIAKVFAQMDKNSDGKVRCPEFIAYVLGLKNHHSRRASNVDKMYLAGAFDEADRNRSGGVTVDEFEVMLGASTEDERQLVRKAFAAADVNSDGKLSIIEFSKVYGKELVQEAKGIEAVWMDVDDEPDSD